MNPWRFLGPCALLATGCLQVLGTDDLTPCTGDACDDDDGAGGDDCVDVTMVVPDELAVTVVEDDDETDFKKGTRTECVDTGEVTLTAICDEGDNKDLPVAVGWGNPRCGDGSTCTLELASDETFTITFASGASCP